MILTSCQKEELTNNNKPINENVNDLRAADGETLYTYSEWYYDPNCQCLRHVYVFIFCAWPYSNCLQEVVINEQRDDLAYYADEFTNSYNQLRIPEYFSGTNYKILFPEIDNLDGIVDSIIENKIVLHKFFNSHDSTDYYIGLRNDIEFSDEWDSWAPKASCVLRLKDKRSID